MQEAHFSNTSLVDIESSGVKTTGKFANNILFKPTVIENRWVCCCGTINDIGCNCGTCGNSLESSKELVKPERIQQVEKLETNKKEMEAKGEKVKFTGVTLKVLVAIMLTFQFIIMFLDRVPIILRPSRDAIIIAASVSGIILLSHISMCFVKQIKDNETETYGKFLSTVFIVANAAEIAMYILKLRNIGYIAVICGIFLANLLQHAIVLKQ